MADDEWDADDFEPDAAAKAPSPTDKWEGEDEDEDVKGAWDDEDEEEEEEAAAEAKPQVPVKAKKSLKEKIAEREEKKRIEEEARRQREEEERRNMTPEEIQAEKLRLKQIQEDSDLELVRDITGVSDVPAASGVLDTFNPSDKEEFDKFNQLLREKICQSENSIHYVGFLENLFRDLSVSLEPDDIKKLASTLNIVANEKTKQQKGAKGKKKGKGKAFLRVSKPDNYDDYRVDDDAFDDFM